MSISLIITSVYTLTNQWSFIAYQWHFTDLSVPIHLLQTIVHLALINQRNFTDSDLGSMLSILKFKFKVMNFIFAQTYFLSLRAKFFENDAILINHDSCF